MISSQDRYLVLLLADGQPQSAGKQPRQNSRGASGTKRHELEAPESAGSLPVGWTRCCTAQPGGNMVTAQDDTIAGLQRAIAELRQQRDIDRTERDAALTREAALAD